MFNQHLFVLLWFFYACIYGLVLGLDGAILEPPGVCRLDGKRADGLTIMPFIKGKSLLWDATCTDTFCPSNLPSTLHKAGSAAEKAVIRKKHLYRDMSSNSHFVVFATETMGSWCKEAKDLIETIGSMLNKLTGDSNSKKYIKQRISIAIQRGNALSILKTLPETEDRLIVIYIPKCACINQEYGAQSEIVVQGWGVGGKKAVQREFPHMALIGYNDSVKMLWLCGGTLISDQFVLTAAHCFETNLYGPSTNVRLGEHDLSVTDNTTLEGLDITRNRLIATGWGRDEWNVSSNVLMKVTFVKFSRSDCDNVYGIENTWPLGILEETQLCQGDSGGGMKADGPSTNVRLGEHDLSVTDNTTVDLKIIERFRHPEYNTSKKYNDIGLLRLEHRVKFNDTIRPAYLPEGPGITRNRLIATGWGRDEWNVPSNVLMKVTLVKFSQNDCDNVYGIENAWPLGILEETQLCAGSLKKLRNTCQGDSGGPIHIYHETSFCTHTVVGVTSFGYPCHIKGIPGVYVKIYPYLKWIKSIVSNSSSL